MDLEFESSRCQSPSLSMPSTVTPKHSWPSGVRLVGKASDPDLSRGVKGQIGGPSTALAWRDLLFLCAVDLSFPKMRLAVSSL